MGVYAYHLCVSATHLPHVVNPDLFDSKDDLSLEGANLSKVLLVMVDVARFVMLPQVDERVDAEIVEARHETQRGDDHRHGCCQSCI